MRANAPFKPEDLAELDESLFERATQVISMQEIHDGNKDPRAIGLRHDVDAGHALATAVKIADWEKERGYRATFFLLHTSPYWNAPGFRDAVDRIAECGHEIGIHANALAESLRTGEDPDLILEKAIGTLRGFGFPVRGVAGHGDRFCNIERNIEAGEISFANDEQFVECRRPQEGPADRLITRGKIERRLRPRPLADFGLEYEALKLAYGKGMLPFRISDSGGRWLNPGWEETVEKWNRERAENPWLSKPTKDIRQMHFLWHPDWWAQAFRRAAVAA